MSRLSDIIEDYINQKFQEGKEAIEIQRNEIAIRFNCAPSQINYVLTTRFTTDRGYYIESRRGGGGCIKIMRVAMDKDDYFLEVLFKKIGDSINKERAVALVEFLYDQKFLEERSRNIIKAAVDDGVLAGVQKPLRDNLRADILKAMILAALMG